MYAIIKTGGKQYKVEPGDEIFVEKLDIDEGDEVTFDEVIAVSGDEGLSVGDSVSSAKVIAKAVKHGKSKKIIVFKYKSKKDYRKKRGHRQPYTKVKIDSILV